MSLCKVVIAKTLAQRFSPCQSSSERLFDLANDGNGFIFIESVNAPHLLDLGLRPGDNVAYLDGSLLVATTATKARLKIDRIWNSAWKTSLDLVLYRHYTQPFSFDGILVPLPDGVRWTFPPPTWV